MAAAQKMWGERQFWGVGSDYDPPYTLTEEQKQIERDLIELCRTTLRPNAVVSDETYEFPRANMDALARMGLLSLIVPKELGGRGQNHVCVAMVVETIARYGCPSTAMVYCMHTSAVAGLCSRYHDSQLIQDVLRRLDQDKLIGTLSYSDPASGGHFWYVLSSKSDYTADGNIQMLKFSSWTTSAGFADFYVVETLSPGVKDDMANMTAMLLFADEVRAHTSDWSGLGVHGNQSGMLISEGILGPDRIIGRIGEGAYLNDESVLAYFVLVSSACWSGIAMGCIDIARKHVTDKRHADVGMRVCDYPTIQDYFGDCVLSTNACRMSVYSAARFYDKATNNNDWTKYTDADIKQRSQVIHWGFQSKYQAARNAAKVSDKMLHACGGAGYKTDMGLERLLRDSKAGSVMGPTNEVIRQWVGQSALLGMDVFDLWAQRVKPGLVHAEVKKMTLDEKRKLAERLLSEVELEENGTSGLDANQDVQFDNPFATCLPRRAKVTTSPGLDPDVYAPLTLLERIPETDCVERFLFQLPRQATHTGCLPGQYVQVKVQVKGKIQERYLSPMSRPDSQVMEVGMRLESHGLISDAFRQLKKGDILECRGPCGGFEYVPGTLDNLVLIATGIGATPVIQLVRCIAQNPDDLTRVTVFYHARNIEQLLCRNELTKYAAEKKNINVALCVDEGDDKWTGLEGLIDRSTLSPYLPVHNGHKNKFVICAGPQVVVTILEILREGGHPSQDIYVYGAFGTRLVRSVFGRNAKLSTHKSD
ncbi:uncharacterized protein LOC106177115 [Lingula anatina]|uniref:Uncharacterized protein LOC106177115 n=1 Tax=Lingula anatina TaxID=7574 RepID=A0A1S3JYZ7_LINAN|nr:uncharacterized protein LOC106177115 [Lingula anatina]|eukprot:XP_013415256.1 uncharacterized protein LOC106177115 [Lingula anatina]